MEIKSILNNSALIARDQGEEKVLVGKGISFGKHPGDLVDERKIEKVFTQADGADDLEQLLGQIPEKYFEAASVIIRNAEKKLKDPLDKSIAITLPDHIDAVMERYRNHQQLTYALLNDLKLLYPDIYAVSEWALDYLNAAFDVNLIDDEAGFLAMHFLNATKGEKSTRNARKVMKFVHTVTDVIHEKYADAFQTSGMSYSRFLAHLKYLAIRYFEKQQLNEDISFTLKISKDKSELVKRCLRDIEEAVKESFGSSFSNDEENYLKLHLARLLNEI